MSSWSFRGVALDDFGIVTLVSDSLMMPERRSENILIPFQDGRVFVEKQFEQRTMSLGLEITEASLVALEGKMDTVKALLGKRSLGTLIQVLEDASVRSIQAEYTGDLHLTRVSPLCVRLLLEFIAPHPFFQGTDLVSDLQVMDAAPKNYSIINPGTADVRDPKIVLAGPLDHVVITNLTNGVSLSYNAMIDEFRIVTIQKSGSDYVAADDLGENLIGNVSHTGSSSLFILDAGENEIELLDGLAANGSVTVEFFPAYL